MSHLARPDPFPATAPAVPPPTVNLRRMLVLLVAVVAMLLVGAAALFLTETRNAAMDEATVRIEGTARLLEEHIRRTFTTSDYIARRAAEIYLARRAEGRNAGEALWNDLMALAGGLPERGSLWIIDADGTVVATTREFPLSKQVDISDRAWFRSHAGGAARIVGPLSLGRYDGALFFSITRRIEAPDGTFLGVASASIDAAYFTDFHQTLSLGQRGNTAVVRLDGQVVLRQPDPQLFVDRSIVGGALFAALQERREGIVRALSVLDSLDRMVAYRALPDFGVAVAAGVVVDDMLADWRHNAVMTAAMVALLLGALGLLATVAFRSLAREEATLRGLERAVDERTEEARAQAEQARRANQSKTRFLAAASHDLRQPLQAAGMFVEALAACVAEPRQMSMVDKLRLSIEATNTLLTTLLDVSTLEAGRITPSLAHFPVMPLLAGLADQVENEARTRGLEVRVAATDLRVVSDPVLLERLLRNLLFNALRYTETGRVVMGCRRRGDRVAVVVADTGIGIPADKLDTIFEDFTRLDQRSGGDTRGLGLGLGVVRRMAALLGHRIEVRSRPGRGSSFAVLVPLDQPLQPAE